MCRKKESKLEENMNVETEKVNKLLKIIPSNNFTQLNDLIHSETRVVNGKIGSS